MAISHVVTVRCAGHEYGPLEVTRETSFSALKQIVLGQLTKQDLIQNIASYPFYVLNIEYISVLHDIKVIVIPHENSSVISTFQRLQHHGLCSIYIHLVDIRRRSSHRNMISHRMQIPGVEAINSINYVPKVVSNESISKLTYLRWPLSSNIADYMFWTLSGMASIQGKLLRKIESGKKQVAWREDWFMLIDDKIWIFPLVSMMTAEKLDIKEIVCPTYINLGPNPRSIEVSLLDSNSFCISNSSHDSTLSQESPLTAIAQKIRKKDIFKAKNAAEAQKWISCIEDFVQNHRDNIPDRSLDQENDIFNSLDELIESAELSRSHDFFNKIPVMNALTDARFSNVEGCSLIDVLSNSQLRDRFKRFLQFKGLRHYLILWEHCEDYRRGHPHSFHPYSGSEIVTISSKSIIDSNVVKKWHEKIEIFWLEFSQNTSDGSTISVGVPTDPDAFKGAQQYCWVELIKLADEFVKTNEYWEVVFRLAGNMKTVFPLAEEARRKVQQQQPSKGALTTLTSFMGFSRTAKSSTTNAISINQPAKAHHSNIVALWRHDDTISEMPADWWLLICPHFSTSFDSGRFGSFFSQTPTADFVGNLHADGTSGVEDFINSANHVLGAIKLVTTMKCSLTLNNSAPKSRPISLFIFGGETENFLEKGSRPDGVMKKMHWHDESFAHLTTSGGHYQIVVLSIQLGENLISILDPTTLSLNLQVRLNEVSLVGPSDRVVNSITILDKSPHGFRLDLLLDHTNELDSRLLTSRWLQHISMLRNFDRCVKIILKRGYLQKRGRLNTAFRWRWFELSSDLKLRYFKDDASRAYKGVIDLSMVDGQGVSRSDLELILNMRKINRTWILKGENEREAEEWVLVIRALFELKSNVDDTAENISDHDEEDDDEEEGDGDCVEE